MIAEIGFNNPTNSKQAPLCEISQSDASFYKNPFQKDSMNILEEPSHSPSSGILVNNKHRPPKPTATYKPSTPDKRSISPGPGHSHPNSSLQQIHQTNPTSSKKIKLNKLAGKLDQSLLDFFLKNPAEESSYVDEISMMKHYNK